MRTAILLTTIAVLFSFCWFAPANWAQQPAANRPAATVRPPTEAPGAPPAPLAPPIPAGAVRLVPDQAVWVDRQRKQVLLGGSICLRRGFLEMFACPVGTKEHESIVSIRAPAQLAHAALLVVGAEVGKPVQFTPRYVPAEGTEIEIFVRYMDTSGRFREVRAQEWIRDVKTNAPMTHNWVFAGSGFLTNESDGKQIYLADAGDFICVSNFSTATLDLPIQSTDANDALLFEAFTEHVPPVDTAVLVVLAPKLAAAAGR